MSEILPVLRSQAECEEWVYALPARLRKRWKPIWSHLYG